MKVLNKLGYLLIRGHFPDRFEYQHTDSWLTGIEVMAPERIEQFSHRRYVSLSLLSFHLSCIMAARFPCIMAVQMMGAVPVTTGSTVTVIYDSRTSIMDRIVILISRFL